MKLKEIAHSRTGDKGDISNISLIPYKKEDYEMLKEKVTPEVVKAYFGEICKGEVVRYDIDSICAMNFVLDKTLGGGVTRSLAIDKHGKALGMALMEKPSSRETTFQMSLANFSRQGLKKKNTLQSPPTTAPCE